MKEKLDEGSVGLPPVRAPLFPPFSFAPPSPSSYLPDNFFSSLCALGRCAFLTCTKTPCRCFYHLSSAPSVARDSAPNVGWCCCSALRGVCGVLCVCVCVQVALYAAEKLLELGAIPVTFSDSSGHIFEPEVRLCVRGRVRGCVGRVGVFACVCCARE